MFRPAALSHDPVDKPDNRLVDLMSFVDRGKHLILRNLIGAGFDHDHLFRRGSNGQLQIALIPLLLSRVHDQFAIHHTDQTGYRKCRSR